MSILIFMRTCRHQTVGRDAANDLSRRCSANAGRWKGIALQLPGNHQHPIQKRDHAYSRFHLSGTNLCCSL